jgi:putative flippase GtrA
MKAMGRSAFRYLLISGLSFVLNLGLTVALHEVAGLSEELSYAIALVVVLATNFLFLRYYIYPARHGPFFKQLGLFLASSAVFRGLEYVAFLFGHTLLGLPYVPVLVVVQALSVIAKFLYYGLAVFKADKPEKMGAV